MIAGFWIGLVVGGLLGAGAAVLVAARFLARFCRQLTLQEEMLDYLQRRLESLT